MGSHHSHSHEHKDSESGSGLSTPRTGSRRGTTPRGSVASAGTRSAETADVEKTEKLPSTSLVPVDKLTKLLCEHAQKEEGVNGITQLCIERYLFPNYPELAHRFFLWLQRSIQPLPAKRGALPASGFRLHTERLLVMLDDTAVLETYVRMFGCDRDENTVSDDGLRSLLHTSYKLSMDHYPEGPQACPEINSTLSAVVKGCFSTGTEHSCNFVVRWLLDNCRRLILPVHRYCVHVLSTRYRELSSPSAPSPSSSSPSPSPAPCLPPGLELGPPVLERSPLWTGHALLPMSAAWLLAAAAPLLYSRPPPPPSLPPPPAVRAARARARWAPLYAARAHGLGANRFLHHTTAYRGPTLVVLAAGELVVVVASPVEWRESHSYWGDEHCAVIQLRPTFSVVERGPKLLYLNTTIRGYPRGLRAGADYRAPPLAVNEDFDQLTFLAAPYYITDIEVWGCGDQSSRETQLEIKKWQVHEAERQRQVKLSAADWIEHPDRYLLELAGRPQYNNSAS